MKHILTVMALALLSACSTPAPQPPQPEVWAPKVGERVATNYCIDCPNHIGRPVIITVTKVTSSNSRVTVFSKEFPQGVPLSTVTKW